MRNRAIFLDRDGTIIYERNYLSRIAEIKLLPGTKKALTLLKSSGFLLIVLTNQSGIARGFFDKKFVKTTHQIINRKLGGIIDDFFVCPHSPDAHCSCRKPKNGLLRAAAKRWRINLSSSWIVGDKLSDIMIRNKDGMSSILIGKNGSHYCSDSWNRIVKTIMKTEYRRQYVGR